MYKKVTLSLAMYKWPNHTKAGKKRGMIRNEGFQQGITQALEEKGND